MKKRTFRKATSYVLSAAMVLSACAAPGMKAEAATKKATVKLKIQKKKVKKINKVKWSVKDKKIASISGGESNWTKGR